MKKVLSAIIMVVFTATVAMAAAGPDTVTMKAKNGNVVFNHKAHAALGDCKVCHGEGTPGKVALGKDVAHKMCKECHQKKSGPTKCGECHKK